MEINKTLQDFELHLLYPVQVQPEPTPKQITSLVHEVRRSADISVSLHKQLAQATEWLNAAKADVAAIKKKLKAHETETLKMIVDCGGGKQSLPFDDVPVATTPLEATTP